jgi:hypothetical protein
MWLPLAILISIVIWFYLGAIYLTVVAWLNAVGHLLQGHFTRAAAWFCVGVGMVAWWQGTETIPHPQDFDAWLRTSAWVVGFGALLTFVRFCHRQRAAQTATPSEAAPTVTFMSINIEPDSSQHVVELTPRLRGAKQRPRRLPGPTINPPAL